MELIHLVLTSHLESLVLLTPDPKKAKPAYREGAQNGRNGSDARKGGRFDRNAKSAQVPKAKKPARELNPYEKALAEYKAAKRKGRK